jgi:hypothetical protein
MKTILLAMLMTAAFPALANTECFDIRATTFEPCEDGKEMTFLQGKCAKSYEAESWYCSAIEGEPECFDTRATLFPPCGLHEERIFVQGKCSRNYEVEHSYCS